LDLTSEVGPLEVSHLEYSGGGWLDQKLFYPSNIAALNKLPLVVFTHGWTFTQQHYDYIGEHLASYGYLVMLHANDVGSGNGAATHSASLTTLSNTEFFLEQYPQP
jgi:predicted dienelactone hydrolase